MAGMRECWLIGWLFDFDLIRIWLIAETELLTSAIKLNQFQSNCWINSIKLQPASQHEKKKSTIQFNSKFDWIEIVLISEIL